MKILPATTAVFCLAAAGVSAAQREPPDRPSEPFTVHVFTNEHDDAEAKVPLSEVTKEVAKRIQDRKKWFVVSDSVEKAEILVEVVRHTLEERMRQRIETRVNREGTGKDWVDYTWTQEHHFIEARVDFPGGAQTLVEGVDQREKGGSLKRAATDLAEKLEEVCKKRYWALAEAR